MKRNRRHFIDSQMIVGQCSSSGIFWGWDNLPFLFLNFHQGTVSSRILLNISKAKIAERLDKNHKAITVSWHMDISCLLPEPVSIQEAHILKDVCAIYLHLISDAFNAVLQSSHGRLEKEFQFCLSLVPKLVLDFAGWRRGQPFSEHHRFAKTGGSIRQWVIRHVVIFNFLATPRNVMLRIKPVNVLRIKREIFTGQRGNLFSFVACLPHKWSYSFI